MNPEIKKRLDMIRRGEVPQGYKKTKVGIIPEEWETKSLVECCQKKGMYGINAPAVEFDENLPAYLRITDIDEYGRFNKSKKVSVINADCSKYYLNAGDILFTRTGSTTGKTYLYNDKDGAIVFAGFLIKFSPKKNVLNSKFLKLFAETSNYWEWVKVMSARSGQPGINSEQYSELKIPFMELDEQNKITEMLSCWDEAIEKQEKLIELKKEQEKGLAYKLLTGKKRLKGFIGKWRNKSLSEYFEKINEKNDENNNNILTMSAQSGLIRQEHFFSKQVASENLSRYFLLKNGDYAYNKSYSIGYPFGAIKRLEKFEKGILSPLYICFRIKKRSISNDYCKHYFDSGLLNKEIQKIAQEGARNHGLLNVSSEEFFQMCVHVPADIKEQNAIAEILTTSDREIEILEKELVLMKEQKKGLMELLLTGIIRVVNKGGK